ncbi:hypothetical protein A6723_023975 [Pseudomonas sp. AU11447]|uniref:CbrC family protein n=1 Tax=unclassified Pseudomonas TaxID=196821 RepID=UPI0006D3EFFE|nr:MULTISPECIES: CbrC family protein [unclassified Pseudomonas]OBY90139.1 hypothetical protein A6723_023975 [Pseudomonas sp. AU11447]
MSQTLPAFRYHPEPLSTGSVVASAETCLCCGQKRGYVYTASVYTRHDLPENCLCPWCIADGSAAERFEASFADDYPLLDAGVPDAVVREVCERTPGFASWQQEHWLNCCGDACAFHGDARREDIIALGAAELAGHFADFGWPEKTWLQVIEHYEPAGNPAIYHFRCLHCGKTHYGMDFT